MGIKIANIVQWVAWDQILGENANCSSDNLDYASLLHKIPRENLWAHFTSSKKGINFAVIFGSRVTVTLEKYFNLPKINFRP